MHSQSISSVAVKVERKYMPVERRQEIMALIDQALRSKQIGSVLDYAETVEPEIHTLSGEAFYKDFLNIDIRSALHLETLTHALLQAGIPNAAIWYIQDGRLGVHNFHQGANNSFKPMPLRGTA
jgi:hypothetical protein